MGSYLSHSRPQSMHLLKKMKCVVAILLKAKPISFVIVFSKVFENLLANKLTPDSCFDSLQYGFPGDKDCQKALLSVESIANYFTCRVNH